MQDFSLLCLLTKKGLCPILNPASPLQNIMCCDRNFLKNHSLTHIFHISEVVEKRLSVLLRFKYTPILYLMGFRNGMVFVEG